MSDTTGDNSSLDNDPLLVGVTKGPTISAGSKIKVATEKLKPFFDHHKRSTDKEDVIVEVLKMGMGTTDLGAFAFVVIEVRLVDNDDPIDGLEMCVGFGDLVTIKS
jgi:hypothetical protein